MRHRLITPGGEIYLPLAESAIRKLLKLGLPYADQSFVVDGFTIRVRVEPGNEYIKIEGGMDPHGFVVTASWCNPVFYKHVITGDIDRWGGFLRAAFASPRMTYNALNTDVAVAGKEPTKITMPMVLNKSGKNLRTYSQHKLKSPLDIESIPFNLIYDGMPSATANTYFGVENKVVSSKNEVFYTI